MRGQLTRKKIAKRSRKSMFKGFSSGRKRIKTSSTYYNRSSGN